MTIANNVGYGDKQKTNWVRCNVWGKKAESKLVDYLKKGQQVFVSGELTLNEYKANDGTTKSNLELNANILDLVGSKKEGGQQQAPTPQRQETNDTPYDDFDDSIPF